MKKQNIEIKLFEIIDDEYYYDGKKINVNKNSQGYHYLRINGKNRRLHRLVALRYISNPLGYKVVDHKDGDKNNNSIDNLQWTTHSDNSKKAYKNNENMRKMHEYKKTGRKITSEKDGVIIFHESIRQCGAYLDRDSAAVHRCLQGEWTYCNGHKLYYTNE